MSGPEVRNVHRRPNAAAALGFILGDVIAVILASVQDLGLKLVASNGGLAVREVAAAGAVLVLYF
jgi:hypothetical protein